MQPATPTLESSPAAVAQASPRQPRPEPLTTHWLRGGSIQPETWAVRLAAPSSTSTPALSPKSITLAPLKPSVPLPIGRRLPDLDAPVDLEAPGSEADASV